MHRLQEHANREPLPLKDRLQGAVRYARHVCLFGASNRQADIERTNGWVAGLIYRNCQSSHYRQVRQQDLCRIQYYANVQLDPDVGDAVCTVKQWYLAFDDEDPTLTTKVPFKKIWRDDPLRDQAFQLTPAHIQIIMGSMQALIRRQGKCAVLSALVCKYLWENPAEIERIERISMKSFDHCFLIVNRKGDLQNPATWGEDAYVIDAWVGDGLIFPADEFKERLVEIKNFAREQAQYRQAIRMTKHPFKEDAVDVLESAWEFSPLHDTYPSYTPQMKFEEYYYLQDYRYGKDYARGYRAALNHHQLKFKPCMAELKKKVSDSVERKMKL